MSENIASSAWTEASIRIEFIAQKSAAPLSVQERIHLGSAQKGDARAVYVQLTFFYFLPKIVLYSFTLKSEYGVPFAEARTEDFAADVASSQFLFCALLGNSTSTYHSYIRVIKLTGKISGVH